MSILDILYTLLIGPLTLFFEVVFSIANRVIDNPGLSIIFLSLAMNFLVLPLYRQADAMQEAERDRANEMKPWVDHIKKTFKGDERFMMLQTYYRQVGYKQTDALKGSLSLLLEIPFFIAAYQFLSHLELLHGVQFGPIYDLGAPDALLVLGGITINVLPLLMTAINIVSGAIYMKGFPLKSKVQMYGIAAIFLILLYNSPAGLVFYWTLNNVFSLVKNIFYKLKNPRLVLAVLASIVGLAGIVAALFVIPPSTSRRQLFIIIFCVLLQLPLLTYWLKKKVILPSVGESTPEDKKLFLWCGILLAVLTGVLIPSAIIGASPAEFVDVQNYKSPLWFIVSSSCLSIGLFLIWFNVFYNLASTSGKRLWGLVVWLAAGVGVVDYMFFGLGYGNLSPLLQYDNALSISKQDVLVNIAACIAAIAVLFVVWKKGKKAACAVSMVACLALVGMSALNIVQISRDLNDVSSEVEAASAGDPTVPLSKMGQNVVVIMLDRGASQYVSSLMYEKPKLEEQFSGFTFYPNCISYGSATNVGVPGIYGGYEYIPEAMNARPEKTIGEKNDEALKVMPALFDGNGYDVTVFDPTYAGYKWIPDLTIYDDYPDVRRYITMGGRFSVEGFEFESASEIAEKKNMRNFFCFSIFKISPVAFHISLYDKGNYNSADTHAFASNSVGMSAVTQTRDGMSKAVGLDERFMDSYAVLDNLPRITEMSDSSPGTFLMMSNDTAHQPALLSEPDYVPAWVVDNTEYDAQHQKRYAADGSYVEPDNQSKMMHYQANMAALSKLGDWFDYLRENGVYDNTRIIIVSDHSWPLWTNKDLFMKVNLEGKSEPKTYDPLAFNCLLLVKDFNASGFNVDTRFMTNADTPSLAMEGLIQDPVNPFTGNPITDDTKNEPEQHLMYAGNWKIASNNGNVFLPDHWFAVHDDIFVSDNWSYLGVY